MGDGITYLHQVLERLGRCPPNGGMAPGKLMERRSVSLSTTTAAAGYEQRGDGLADVGLEFADGAGRCNMDICRANEKLAQPLASSHLSRSRKQGALYPVSPMRINAATKGTLVP